MPDASPSYRSEARTAPPWSDDAVLVAQAQQQRAAFAPLYQRYLDPIYRYCYRRLGSVEAAEDATSLVFERALAALPTYRDGSFRAWLFAIAHNVVVDAVRRRRLEPAIEQLAELPDPAIAPDEAALRAEEQRRLAAALAHLSPDQQHVIALRLSGVPTSEAARLLDRTPEAIRALQCRALRRLQALLDAADAIPTECGHAD